MERDFQIKDTPEARRLLDGQLRECFGRAVYSHKTHEKCSDILQSHLSTMKLAQIILSSLTTCGFAYAIFDSAKWLAIIGAIVSAALLVLNFYTKDYDLGEVAQKHKQAANSIWLVRERYLSLIADLAMDVKPLERLIEARNELSIELNTIYKGSPSTTYEAYKKAQKALKVSEDMTFSDAEIDKFLPKDLHKAIAHHASE